MKLKRISIRFDLDNEVERKSWELLQKSNGVKNKVVIDAINAFLEPNNESVLNVVRNTIMECFRKVSFTQVATQTESPTLSDEENSLLNSLEEFLG